MHHTDIRPVMVIAGASGLVGAAMLAAAQARGWRTIALYRKGQTGDVADDNLQVDFERLDMIAEQVSARKPRAFLCALGSTIRKAGSQQVFARIDRDYVEAFAALGHRLGASRFGLVSSIGANAASPNFYLRTKGEAEERVRALGFARLDIARPSLILGPRRERRFVESLSQQAAGLLTPVLVGPLQKYRAIQAHIIGDALTAGAMQERSGIFIHDYQALRRLAAEMTPPDFV